MKNFFFKHSNIGKSHVVKKMPLQDSVDILKTNNHTIACVSDGHGSKLHFYSNIGSKLLTKIVINKCDVFLKDLNLDYARFLNSNISVFKFGINQEYFSTPENKKLYDDLNTSFLQLYKSIITEWNLEIEKHWLKNKPKLKFLENIGLSQDWIDVFLKNEQIEVAYGCTLISYVLSSNFLFCFQLGDGTCVTLDKESVFHFPIIDDPNCKGNTTTSLCDNNAVNNIRYSIQFQNLPNAVFIASDGLDGAFSLIDDIAKERLKDFYLKVFNCYKDFGERKTKNELKNAIKNFSNNGVKLDDISLACSILEI